MGTSFVSAEESASSLLNASAVGASAFSGSVDSLVVASSVGKSAFSGAVSASLVTASSIATSPSTSGVPASLPSPASLGASPSSLEGGSSEDFSASSASASFGASAMGEFSAAFSFDDSPCALERTLSPASFSSEVLADSVLSVPVGPSIFWGALLELAPSSLLASEVSSSPLSSAVLFSARSVDSAGSSPDSVDGLTLP
mmetsp:Transcript_28731/g.83310  ORF Transcript_28731/g.83310 Transcript_28731/m.83310 type:complete len:200 (+) Transcript_28731:1169-1768(+)